MNEQEFERSLIDHICFDTNVRDDITGGEPITPYLASKQWEYRADIKSTEALWKNFKEILEQHNQSTLEYPLSAMEFNQVKKIISNLHTPYEAGQFLYGLNGVSQIEIDLDDGRHVFLTVFDQKQIGAGDTVYQVVNQIRRPAKITGKKDRIFDTTLLINGLPILQIEEKTGTRDVNEALNQMHQYIEENQYSDIFSTLQILIGMTPYDAKYMANTRGEFFNKDFAFHWQEKDDNTLVRNWKKFTETFLSIPMAHQMATNYMILDGTPNRQMLKVMRPYQVYATQKVMDKIKEADFDYGLNKLGYIWHTTGSGKTITSFKTAWLASRSPKIDKVVFVVDRIALTRQTLEEYRAYSPEGGKTNEISSIQDTENTSELSRKLKVKDDSIIITSVQKLDKLVKRESFQAPERNFLFVVDEAHRSTGGESFARIQKAFPRSAWVGYTGTPMFDDTTKGLRTEDVFGEPLHAYTIREAIADGNVLGFKVDFETTIDEEDMKKRYLPEFYRTSYPHWSPQAIQEKIDNLTPEDMDDTIAASFYDENMDHIQLVVQDIFKNWKNRSNEGKYNALLTTHVGGGKASTPMAYMYFQEFHRVNQERKKQGLETLKVALSYSLNTSNNNIMTESNKALHEAMRVYNLEFDTSFGLDSTKDYSEDLISRLNKTAPDGQYLDLVIVVDQLLTGFNAPELNTLYVDRSLSGASLIQAYSRTNRVHDMQEKPWGRIVNYRWPAHNEKKMNDALAIYANKDSAILSDEERKKSNQKDKILIQDFPQIQEEVKELVDEIRQLTMNFNDIPPSENQREVLYSRLKEYNAGIAKLKQFKVEEVDGQIVGFDYEKPEELIKGLGMTQEEEETLTTSIANQIKDWISQREDVPLFQVDLKMTHVKDVKVNYDYLTKLVQDLLNQVHYSKMKEAGETKEKIIQFANALEDRIYAEKVKNATTAIYTGLYKVHAYPVYLTDSVEVIEEANGTNITKIYGEFINDWGLVSAITTEGIKELFRHHRYGLQDMDEANQIRDLITKASLNYKDLAMDPAVAGLSKIKYRNQLREALYKLADQMVEM